MIVTNIYKNICRSRILSHCSRSLANNLCKAPTKISAPQCESTTSRNTDRIFWAPYRNYSTESEPKPEPEPVTLPPISNFPPALWPKFFTTLKNFLIINMVIKSKIDKEFDETEFLAATKQALLVISRALANENYDQLDGLVTSDVIDSLKENISKLSSQQKECIAVEEDDVYLSFPSSVKIMNEERDRKFVEISVVHHYMRGLGLMKKSGEVIPLTLLQDHQDRIFVANYRFLREYTEGTDSSWIVNAINHFSPSLAYSYQQQ